MEEDMSVVTVRLPDDQHQRLKAMAQARGISLNKLFEQLTAQALTENDIELRYRRLAATGSPARGLELLDKLDRSESEH
jgi:predicted transcriptional regulator